MRFIKTLLKNIIMFNSIKEEKKMLKVYLSGAITGKNYDTVKREFKDAEKMVKKYGRNIHVYNPMRKNTRKDLGPQAKDWTVYMRQSIKDLVDSDVMVDVLNGSENSKGVMVERVICEVLKIPVYDINTFHKFYDKD